MEFTSRACIHEWLSKTEDCYDQSSLVSRPFSSLQSAGTKSQVAQRNLVHTKSRRDLPVAEKATADTKLLQTLFAPTEGELRRYERRPRHKTKEDHYEYNGSFRTKEKKYTKFEKRSVRKNRKHTINDNFHASNVPRDRVTLGLFRKGRASSAVKTGQVPLPAFSETKFLEKARLPDKERHWADRDKERKGGSRTGISKNLLDRFSFASPRADKVGKFDFVEGTKSQPTDMVLKTTNQHTGCASFPSLRSIRGRGESVFPSNGETVVTGRTLDDDETPRGRSRVPKPCTASQLDQTQLELEQLFDLYCKRLLLFDLTSEDNENTSNISHRAKRYRDLNELKALLEKRQRPWGPNGIETTFTENLHLPTSTKGYNLTPNDSSTATGRPFKRRKITSMCGTEYGSALVDHPSKSPAHQYGCNTWPDRQQEGNSHRLIEASDGTAVHALGPSNMSAHTSFSAGVSEGGGPPYFSSWIKVRGSQTPARSTSDYGLDGAGGTVVYPHKDAGIEYNMGGTLYTADLDVEYEGIVYSEGVPQENTKGDGPGDSMTDVTDARRNGSIFPVAQNLHDSYGLTIRPLSHTPFDTVGTGLEEAHFPSKIQDTSESPKFARSAYGPKRQGSCHDAITARFGDKSHAGDILASGVPVNPALELAQASGKDELVLPENFWRQNKLY